MKWVLIFVTMSASAATNLLENSSFEAGDLRGWSRGAYSTYTASPEYPFHTTNLYVQHGARSIRIPTGGTEQWTMVSRMYRLKPNTQYTLSCYVKGQYTVSAFYTEFNLMMMNSRSGLDTHHTIHVPANTNYNRYSMTFTTTNIVDQCTYQVQISLRSQANPIGHFLHVDAVQLEEAASATAFAPMTPVEIGTMVDRTTPAHIYYPDEAAKVYLAAFNNTAQSSNLTVNWAVYDWWNVLKASGTKPITSLANTTTVDSVTFTPTGKTNGWYRFVGWVNGVEESLTEATFAVLPRPITISDRTNGMFGVEVYPSDWFLAGAQRLGFRWARNLSVFHWSRWTTVQPATNDWFLFTNTVAKYRTYDLEPLANIGNGQSLTGIPAWAMDASRANFPSNILWSNFCVRVVGDYKPFIRYWEVWNEAGEVGEYTNVLKWASGAIRLADSNAVIVAPAHAYFAAVSNVVGIVGTNHFNIWSTHLYPTTEIPGENSLDSIGILGTTNAMRTWGYPGWNTETGFRSDTAHELALWEENLFTPSISPAGGGYNRHRAFRVHGQVRNMLGTMIGPITKYFYYDGRNTGGHNGYIAYSVFDYDNTIGPMGVALASIINLREGGTNGENASLGALVDSYTWARSNQVYFALFPTNVYSFGASDKLAVSSSDSNTIFYDIEGNPSTGTTLFGRDYVIVKGASGVSSNTLATSLTIWKTNDIAAPNLSITTWPTSYPPPERYTYRWTAVDDTVIDTRDVSSTNAIQYSYQLVGFDSGYSGWTNRSWVTYTNQGSPSAFNVRAKDASGNTTEITMALVNSRLNLNVGVISFSP